MSKRYKVLVGVLVLFLLAFLGCAGIQNAVTPAYIPEDNIEYSGAEVPRWPGIYTNINDAEYVLKRMEYVRSLSDLEYAFLTDDLQTHLKNAKELRDNVFDPSSPLGMMIPALSGLVLGWIGLSRPEDKKKVAELERKTNGTNS